VELKRGIIHRVVHLRWIFQSNQSGIETC